MLKLFEASHLALDGEKIMDKAIMFSTKNHKTIISNSDVSTTKQLSTVLELLLHWRLEWYNVTRHIHEYGKVGNINFSLLKLAKLHFNMVVEESWDSRKFKLFTGLNNQKLLICCASQFEPQYKHVRIWLAKVYKFIITIDDVYDVYGSPQELELFTKAALYDTTNEITFEIQKVKGGKSVLPHLRKVWKDFCTALLVEAKWYNQGYTPSLQEYLNNGWISSGDSALSVHVLFGVAHEITEDVLDFLKNGEDLVYHISMIIRLTNDQGTSVEHIRSIITKTWKNINDQSIPKSPSLVPFAKYITNIARVSHFIYHNGDGYGVQDCETRDQIVSLLIEPLALD
ncbi:unnamed protein product [Ilex paraguariensis]|uniref:Terpene synthase metal-binding domain-containing protein n=1 Tax=Ilex paraguariensis TaxID=185542 RepID=A0ABC8RHW4_9AQUA